MAKQNVEYSYSYIECYIAMKSIKYRYMDETWKYGKWMKAESKGHMLYCPTYMKCPE